MISRARLALGAALVAVAVAALTACGNPNGLAAGEPAPSVSAQPSPEAVWPSWSGPSSNSPAADTTEHQAPPEALPASLKVPAGGLGELRVQDLLRADARMRPYADRELIHRPGQSGIRPAKLVDLTGDDSPELLVAVDTESGSTVLAVYQERDGRVYPILYARGKRVTIETVGIDLVLRSPCTDGAEQAVRYRWDGSRMVTMSDTKTYAKPGATPTAPSVPPAPASPGPSDSGAETSRSSRGSAPGDGPTPSAGSTGPEGGARTGTGQTGGQGDKSGGKTGGSSGSGSSGSGSGDSGSDGSGAPDGSDAADDLIVDKTHHAAGPTHHSGDGTRPAAPAPGSHSSDTEPTVDY